MEHTGPLSPGLGWYYYSPHPRTHYPHSVPLTRYTRSFHSILPYVQSLPSPTSHLVRVRPVLTLPFTSLPYGPLRSLLNHYLPNPLTSRKWSLGWVGDVVK